MRNIQQNIVYLNVLIFFKDMYLEIILEEFKWKLIHLIISLILVVLILMFNYQFL